MFENMLAHHSWNTEMGHTFPMKHQRQSESVNYLNFGSVFFFLAFYELWYTMLKTSSKICCHLQSEMYAIQ